MCIGHLTTARYIYVYIKNSQNYQKYTLCVLILFLQRSPKM